MTTVASVEEAGGVERVELLLRPLVRALALGDVDVERGHLARVHRGPQLLALVHQSPVEIDPRAGLVLAEDEEVHVPDERLLRVLVLGTRSLDRGHSTHQRPRFGIPRQLGQERRRVGQGLPGRSDDRLVLAAAPPGVPVDVALGGLPGREDVELGVAVKVDEPGEDHTVRLDDGDAGRLRRLHRLDRRPLDHHVAALDRLVRGEDAAPESECGLRPCLELRFRSASLARLRRLRCRERIEHPQRVVAVEAALHDASPLCLPRCPHRGS